MGRIRDLAKKAASSSPALRKLARRAAYSAGKRRYGRVTSGICTVPGRILFSSYNGASYSCSPKALYTRMADDPRFDGFEFIWAFTDTDAHAHLSEEPRTSLVKFGSDDYLRALRAAELWVMNSRVYEYVWPAEDQIYVQCWHGTPLKKLGFDLGFSGSKMNDVSEFRWRFGIDAQKFRHIVSPSPFASKAFTSAFGLADLGKTDAVVEIGYPRNDALFEPSSEDAAAARARIGLMPDDGRKAILYAPTFRDYEYRADSGYGDGIRIDFGKLRASLGDEYVVLLRTHYLVSSGIDIGKYGGFVVDCSRHDDINDLFLAADLLITDYSSVFFDYANLRKPMLFFMPDRERYERETRGFYIGVDELPGEIINDGSDVAQATVQTLRGFAYNEKYRRFREKFCPLDDGRASERLADLIAADTRGPC